MSAVVEQTKTERELWHIAGTGDVEGLNHLLDQGANVNAGDRTGVTALMRAAYHGQVPMVQALIARGADVNATDRSGLTALMMAKHAGHKEIVDALLALGAHGPRPAQAKPRLIVPADETAAGVAEEQREVKVKKSAPVRTLHEPPEIWEMVHTTHAGSAKADDTPPVRTLHEPQEILNAVQTTQPEPRFALAAVRRLNLPRPLIAGSALIVCALVVFGWWFLRGGESSSPPPAPQQVKAISTKPISLPHQPPAVKTSTGKSKRLTSPPTSKANVTPAAEVLQGDFGSLAVAAAIEEATSERVVKPAVARPPAVASAKKVEPKTQNRAAKTSARLHEENNYVRKPRKSVTTEAETAVSLKKDAGKPPTQQSTDPPKASSQPKPKVIQWP
jgi:Ankyrin repeats (3 copies)